jgi:predicted amino acid-binding ACT domain protein|tara:strand:- start:211 stop:501 length:291 start_codon:yes stop_codon:yes gene_type:complete
MIVGKIAKAVLKLILPQIAELLVPVKKYCFEDNELDIKSREFEQKLTDQAFRITALVDMVKSKVEIIDNMKEELKEVNGVIKKIKNKKMFKSLFNG